jgi:hypothetical protein
MFPVDFLNSGFNISIRFPYFGFQKFPLYFLISEFVMFAVDFLNSVSKSFQ